MAIPDIKQIITAVYTKLAASAALLALTGDGVIYSGFVVKGTASRPYVLIRPPQGLTDVGSKSLNLWEFRLGVLVVTAETESSSTLESMVDLVIENLHRSTLTLGTDTHVLTECVGLTPTPSDDDLAAVVLNFNITISQ